jgi:hypothetical protein
MTLDSPWLMAIVAVVIAGAVIALALRVIGRHRGDDPELDLLWLLVSPILYVVRQVKRRKQ